MPRKMASSNGVKYERMEEDTGYTSKQFKKKSPKIPLKSIGVALLLCIIGTTLLVIGSLLVSGKISSKHEEKLWPVIILGLICFIPGFYHVRLALYAYQGYDGYSFDDIPDYDD